MDEAHWLIRLSPKAGVSLEKIFELRASFDVWEREESGLIVQATATQVIELEKNPEVEVERLSTISDYKQRFDQRE